MGGGEPGRSGISRPIRPPAVRPSAKEDRKLSPGQSRGIRRRASESASNGLNSPCPSARKHAREGRSRLQPSEPYCIQSQARYPQVPGMLEMVGLPVGPRDKPCVLGPVGEGLPTPSDRAHRISLVQQTLLRSSSGSYKAIRNSSLLGWRTET